MTQHSQRHLGLRVVEFFQANPDEELTVSDVAAKFGVPARAVVQKLAFRLGRGELLRKGNTYAPGPKLGTAVAKVTQITVKRPTGPVGRHAELLAQLQPNSAITLPLDEQRNVAEAAKTYMRHHRGAQLAVRKLTADVCIVVRLESEEQA